VEIVEEDFFFTANGDKISLKRDEKLFTVRFRRGRSLASDDLGAKASQTLKDRSDARDFIAKYNLQVFEAREDAADASVRAVRSVEGSPAVALSSPVFKRSDAPADRVYLSGRVLVAFEDGVSEAKAGGFLKPILDDAKATIDEAASRVEPDVLLVVEAGAGDGENGPISLARRIFEEGTRPNPKLVRYAEPDLIQQRHFKQIAPAPRTVPAGGWTYEARQWTLDSARVREAWAITEGSPEVPFGITDDGIDMSHREFAGRIRAAFDFATGLPDNASPKSPYDNHGTACAGVAAAGSAVRGVAPRCGMVLARTPDMMGNLDEAEMFRWMADSGAAVISCSWGPPDGTGASYPLPSIVADAMRYCRLHGRNGKGTPIVFASGNGSESVSLDGYASSPEVIAVGACNHEDAPAPYSDFGPEVWICAPSSGNTAAGDPRVFTTDRTGTAGYNVGSLTDPQALDNNYTDDFGGTSAAAPLVAGVIVLMLTANLALTWQEVRDILRDTAVKIGDGYDANGHSPRYGYGKVDALAAVTEAKRRVVPGDGTGDGGSNNGGTGDGGGTDDGSTTPPPEPPQGKPVVTGPATVARGSPTFDVVVGAGRFYGYAVATDEALFANAAARSPATYYATWNSTAVLSNSPTFRIPQGVWDQLSLSDRLCIRVTSSAARDGWVDTRKSEIFSFDVTDAVLVPNPS
jgi:hypothetical protein